MWYKRNKYIFREILKQVIVLIFEFAMCVFLTYCTIVGDVSIGLKIVWMVIVLVFCFNNLFGRVSLLMEKFSIEGNVIKVKKLIRIKEIEIPDNIVIIISKTNLYIPYRAPIYEYANFALKDRYALTILHDQPIGEVMTRLHRGYVREYTDAVVHRDSSLYKYIYSFVFNQDLVNQVINGRNVSVIIPENLLDKVSFEVPDVKVNVKVYVDKHCTPIDRRRRRKTPSEEPTDEA